MERKVMMTSLVGILVGLCIVAILLLSGCESSSRVVASKPSDTCPICERQTRVNPITRLEYTTCICPTCGRVYTLDQATLDAIERFTGPDIGDRVAVCDSCGNILTDCAQCREKAGLRAGGP